MQDTVQAVEEWEESEDFDYDAEAEFGSPGTCLVADCFQELSQLYAETNGEDAEAEDQEFEVEEAEEGPKEEEVRRCQQEVNEKDWRRSVSQWRTETYIVQDDYVEMIKSHFGMWPEIDGFATEENTRCPDWWDERVDAFSQCWAHKELWLNPPWSKLDQVLVKIMVEEARGILILPK